MIDLVRIWWALALQGMAAVLFGLLALALPFTTPAGLANLVGAHALVDGAFALVRAALALGRHAAWLGRLAEGALGVSAGVTAVALLALTALRANLNRHHPGRRRATAAGGRRPVVARPVRIRLAHAQQAGAHGADPGVGDGIARCRAMG